VNVKRSHFDTTLLATLLFVGLDGLDALVSLDLGLGGHFSLDLLLPTVLDLLFGSLDSLVTVLTGLGALSLDLVKGHAHNGLAHLCGLACVSFLDIIDSDLLVLGAPFLGPAKVDSFDALVEH